MALPAVNDPTGLYSKEISGTDLAGKVLEALFGDGWQNITQAVSEGSSSEAASLILTLLQAMSTVALSIGTVIMVYTVVIGVVGTAHEGTPMGKKLSSLWAPIRGAASVAMLVPTAKGLNFLMVIILACVAGSVNFANYLTDKSYDFLQRSGGQIAITAPPSMRTNIESIATEAVKNLAAQHYMAYKLGQEFDTMYFVLPPAEGHEQYTILFQAPQNTSLKDSDFGSISIPCTFVGEDFEQPDAICVARTSAMLKLISDLTPTAQSLAANILTEKELKAAGAPKVEPVDDDAMRAAADKYIATITPIIPEILATSDPDFQKGLEGFTEQAKKDGWILLGSYYWTISRFTEHVHDISGNMPIATSGKLAAQMSNAWDDPAFSALLESTEEVVRRGIDKRVDNARAGTDGFWAQINAWVQKAIPLQEVGIAHVAKKLTENDPIIALSDLGHTIIGTAEVMWGSAIASEITVAITAGVADAPLAATLSGGASKGIADGASKLTERLMQGLGTIVIGLLVFGLFAAFYLPALPWIIWMSAVVGWLILIVETLFAAPLWALGHLMPEGDGMAGQHGRQGYMLLLGVLARPPLMVAGFFASIIIFAAVGKIVGFSFMVYSASVSAPHLSGIVTILAHIALIVMVFIVLAHKVFGLITHLPENVTKWIGGQASSLGEQQDEARIRGIAMVSGTQGQSIAGAAAGAKGADSGPSEGGGSGKKTNTTNDDFG